MKAFHKNATEACPLLNSSTLDIKNIRFNFAICFSGEGKMKLNSKNSKHKCIFYVPFQEEEEENNCISSKS